MVVQPNALRNELALEIKRWYPALTWGEALADADLVIASLIAGNTAVPITLHPLILFIANTFIVPWSWAAGAFEVLAGTGGGEPPLPPPVPPPDPALYLMNYYSFEDSDDDRCRVNFTQSVVPPIYVVGGKGNGKKAQFDGVATTLHSIATAGTGLELSGPRTFYIWVEWLGSDNDDHILSAVDEYFFSHSTVGNAGFYAIVYDSAGVASRVNSGVVAAGAADYLLTFTYDPTTGQMGLAVNIAPFGYATLGSGSAKLPPSKRVDFGSLAGGSAFFDGTIDEVSIWYGVQTNAHRNWMWNSGAGRTFADVAALLVGICPPLKPTGLAAIALGPDNIGLSWVNPATDEDGINIYRSLNGTTGWTLIQTRPPDALTYGDPGLAPVTPYFYKVHSFNEAGESLASNIATATTNAATPAAPTLLTATPISASQINLGWVDNATNEVSYRVESSPNGSTGWAIVSGAGTLPAGTVAYNNTGLTDSTPYWYRVFAENAAGLSLPSNVATATTTPYLPAAVQLGLGEGYSKTQMFGADTAQLLFNAWLRVNHTTSASENLLTVGGAFPNQMLNLYLSNWDQTSPTGGANGVYVETKQSGGVNARGNTPTFSNHGIAAGQWFNLLMRCTMASPCRIWVYLRPFLGLTWFGGEISYLQQGNGTNFAFATASNKTGVFGVDAECAVDMSNVWLSFGTLDISIAANRDKFVTPTGYAKYLGATGQLPTGAAARWYRPDGNFAAANLGTDTGVFTVTGTIASIAGPGS